MSHTINKTRAQQRTVASPASFVSVPSAPGGIFFARARRRDRLDQRVLLEAHVLKTARAFLEQRGFTEIVVPRVVRASGACENVLTLFSVGVGKDARWFQGKKAYLAQTGQLFLEALIPHIPKVWCSGPSFRAEAKVDRRHLAVFHMIEIEFTGNFTQLLDTIEAFLATIASGIASLAPSEAKRLGISRQRLEALRRLKQPFPRITYDEAIAELQRMGQPLAWGDDISSDNEKRLVVAHGRKPLFLTHFPDPQWDHGKTLEVEKFFNMVPDPQRPGRVQSCDVILPFGGEAVGAAARIHDATTLKKRLFRSRMFAMLKKQGGDASDFSWYIKQLETYGSIPHAGCGFGMARILQWLIGGNDIRDAVAFPTTRASLI